LKTYRTFAVILFLIAAAISVRSNAQTADQIYKEFAKGYHSNDGVTLPFYLFVPANYDSTQKYPLVFCLHGAGERGDDSTAVERNSMATVWAMDSNQAKWPCFILVPQCPSNGWWVYTSWTGPYLTYSVGTELMTALDILDSLTTKYSVDTNRIYITGLSMGGYGTWASIIEYPNKFAAAVPMSGAGDTSQVYRIKSVPIWDFHGALDNTVPVSGSRDMIHALEDAGDKVVFTNCDNGDCTGLPDNVIAEKIKDGAKLLYTEYEYGNHAIWNTAYYDPFLLPWVFSQSKANRINAVHGTAPIPDKISLWQNYPNPFNPTTRIGYQISSFGYVSLKVYDSLGRKVMVLVHGTQRAGNYSVILDGGKLSSGIYLVELRANGNDAMRKIALVK